MARSSRSTKTLSRPTPANTNWPRKGREKMKMNVIYAVKMTNGTMVSVHGNREAAEKDARLYGSYCEVCEVLAPAVLAVEDDRHPVTGEYLRSAGERRLTSAKIQWVEPVTGMMICDHGKLWLSGTISAG